MDKVDELAVADEDNAFRVLVSKDERNQIEKTILGWDLTIELFNLLRDSGDK